MPTHIFVCYASEDREIAESIALALGGGGYRVFYDQDSLPPGGDYHDQIRAAIRRSDMFVFVASAASVRDGAYTLTELKFARDRWPHPKGRVLPVCVSGVPIESLPTYLKSVTVLEPEGNIAAEVVGALQAMSRSVHRWRNVGIGALSLAAAAAISIAVWNSDRVAPSTPAYADGHQSDQSPSTDPAARLMQELQEVNIHTSRPEQMPAWLGGDARYVRLAEACIAELQGRRLRNVAFLDVVMWRYAEASGLDSPGKLPYALQIDPAKLRTALLAAYNEKNGEGATSLDEITAARL